MNTINIIIKNCLSIGQIRDPLRDTILSNINSEATFEVREAYSFVTPTIIYTYDRHS